MIKPSVYFSEHVYIAAPATSVTATGVSRGPDLCFVCVDGYVVERRDVFALRVFCEKQQQSNVKSYKNVPLRGTKKCELYLKKL